MQNSIELFSGTASFSKIAAKNNHKIHTYDTCENATAHLGQHDNRSILDEALSFPDVTEGMLWASPPCEGFSVAAIGKSWHKEPRTPKSDTARLGMQLLERTIEIIAKTKPGFWFIENPRGMMRKVIDEVFERHGITGYTRHTVTYCQYGDTRMKPTDIWTNCFSWQPKPPCKNGAPCHVAAPRGSTTGTQGINSYREKSRIPADIFNEIFEHIEEDNHAERQMMLAELSIL